MANKNKVNSCLLFCRRPEADEVIWAIKADLDQAVKTLIAAIPAGEWKEPVKVCGYEVAETVHTMNNTKKSLSSCNKERVTEARGVI